MNYASFYQKSIHEPDHFWLEQSKNIPWFKTPTLGYSQLSNQHTTWFEDGMLNMSYACLDAQILAGRGEQTALIYDSPVTGIVKHYTYNSLHNLVATFASGLFLRGIAAGDTVVIYMPMIPEAVIAMLACARIGAIHSVVFGGFAPHELAMRIDDAKPKALITATYGIEVNKKIDYTSLINRALNEATHQPEYIISFARDTNAEFPKGIISFNDIYDTKTIEPVALPSTHPLYILYTSGTTGSPKGIVRDTGGYATALKFSMENIYQMKPGEVFWAASDVGWVVGHSYIVYGPLLQGCTTILYEGKPVKTPDCGSFWRVIEQHRVKVMFTAPTAIRAIKKEDDEGTKLVQYNLNSLQTLFLAGERCDPSTYDWIKSKLNIPVVDHWWQTESGWPMLGIMGKIDQRAAKAGSAGFPVCGYKIDILNEEGELLHPNEEGYVAVKLPLPPGCLPTLWNNHERFIQGYLNKFEGYYLTGDGGYTDDEGYYYIMGRMDDVINVAGHRLSTGEMEELIASHPAIAECAVIGIADELKGQCPIGLVVLKDGLSVIEQLIEQELVALIRDQIGAVAWFKHVVVVKRLPKTRSGKILRKTMRHIADGLAYQIPSTIEDPETLTEIELSLSAKKLGAAFIALS